MNRRWRALFGLVCAAALAGSVIAAPAPVSAFATLPHIREVTISPDGKYLAYISGIEGRNVVVTNNLHLPDPPRRILSHSTFNSRNDYELTRCRWADSTRLLCSARAQQFLTTTGRLTELTHLMAINVDGSEFRSLRSISHWDIGADERAELDWIANDSQSVLLHATVNAIWGSFFDHNLGWYRDALPSVYKLDIYTGKIEKQADNYPPVQRIYSDSQGRTHFGSGLYKSGWQYFARLSAESEWRALQQLSRYESANEFVPIANVAGGDRIYAKAALGDRIGLYEIDLADRSAPRLVFDHPLVDMATPLLDAAGHLIGMTYETDRPFIHYTDDKLAAVMASINNILPTTFNTIRSSTPDRRTLVIGAESDVDAGTYYLYDTRSGELQRIGTAYPQLDPNELGRMRSIEYAARDGTTIPGYLTIPANERAEKLPLIVLPPGELASRTHWRFDYLRAFLVSRGYAVLSMNYRGTAGYGTQWLQALDWHGLTYSDIEDGVRWAIARGYADPRRICIAGQRFAGYAALRSAVRNADLYKCVVSIAGSNDISDMTRVAARLHDGKGVAQPSIASKVESAAESPARYAREVKVPILLVHGARDAVIGPAQSQQLADALRRNGKPHKLLLLDYAAHPFQGESERAALLTEIENFLAAHLGSRPADRAN
jgi:dipeptidyl aminopeptidase/acylaminoacyl peptidase